jgi:hypothetical protein
MNSKDMASEMIARLGKDRGELNLVARADLRRNLDSFIYGGVTYCGVFALMSGGYPIVGSIMVAAGITLYRGNTSLWRELIRQTKT